MRPPAFKQDITRTLLYYEIFDHPLTANELFALHPHNSVRKSVFADMVDQLCRDGDLIRSSTFYQLPTANNDLPLLRHKRERLARTRLRRARLMTHVIKRFPFVRGVFLSGDLSKGVAHPESDVDYVIVTAAHRLWICRILLVLFKKTILFNKKNFFCLNYFVTEQQLVLEDRNYFTATEIAHLKPLYHVELFLRYLNANNWITEYFPNYKAFSFSGEEGNNRRSFLQSLFELPFTGAWVDRLDTRLMEMMKSVWARRYPEVDVTTRERIFRCTPSESCAYVGNYSEKVLALYRDRLTGHQLSLNDHG